jgi:hypothetical protein
MTDYVPEEVWPYPWGDQFASAFDPTGIVPYPCTHGMPMRPPEYGRFRMFPSLDSDGNEFPPYGGRSWGRSKYLFVGAYGGRQGIPFAYAECVVCRGEPRPDDLTTPANA